ncbi:hypothetical protein D030_5190B, partial [Vibrio parahaemolyticus AQ3810]
DTVGGNV